jgi:hypothetical protein
MSVTLQYIVRKNPFRKYRNFSTTERRSDSQDFCPEIKKNPASGEGLAGLRGVGESEKTVRENFQDPPDIFVTLKDALDGST